MLHMGMPQNQQNYHCLVKDTTSRDCVQTTILLQKKRKTTEIDYCKTYSTKEKYIQKNTTKHMQSLSKTPKKQATVDFFRWNSQQRPSSKRSPTGRVLDHRPGFLHLVLCLATAGWKGPAKGEETDKKHKQTKMPPSPTIRVGHLKMKGDKEKNWKAPLFGPMKRKLNRLKVSCSSSFPVSSPKK